MGEIVKYKYIEPKIGVYFFRKKTISLDFDPKFWAILDLMLEKPLKLS